MSYGIQQLAKKNDEGVYVFNTPFIPDKTKMPLFDPASDTGLFVAAALLHGKDTLGKRILAAAGYVTPNELVATFSEVTGKKTAVNQITWEQFRSFLPPPVAEELTGNFQLIADPGYYVGEPADALDKSIGLVATAGLGKPTSWKDYAEKNAEKA
jgi:hypothetical protein